MRILDRQAQRNGRRPHRLKKTRGGEPHVFFY
jgi:hypothetical protein